MLQIQTDRLPPRDMPAELKPAGSYRYVGRRYKREGEAAGA